MNRLRTVGEVAALTGTTVRALHHYDEVGLLEPSARSSTGYRLYSETDIVRLHSILHLRSLGLGLDEIALLVNGADVDLVTGLERQLQRARERATELEAVIGALERAIVALEDTGVLDDDVLRQMFDGFDPRVHDPEVEGRWGDSAPYREYERRAGTYTESQWRQYRAENAANVEAFVALLTAGVGPDDAMAVDAARQHGALIDRWFYPLEPETHLGLADGYVTDSRFEAAYESVAPGLARYISAAIHALHGASRRQ